VITLVNAGEEDKIVELIQAGVFDFLITDPEGLFLKNIPVIMENNLTGVMRPEYVPL